MGVHSTTMHEDSCWLGKDISYVLDLVEAQLQDLGIESLSIAMSKRNEKGEKAAFAKEITSRKDLEEEGKRGHLSLDEESLASDIYGPRKSKVVGQPNDKGVLATEMVDYRLRKKSGLKLKNKGKAIILFELAIISYNSGSLDPLNNYKVYRIDPGSPDNLVEN
ncbi:hypothetical protein Ancab_005716 [Ancistrocladus abbreviatus]